MTGDGVNDAPALKAQTKRDAWLPRARMQVHRTCPRALLCSSRAATAVRPLTGEAADIGVAMGVHGTEVAKGARLRCRKGLALARGQGKLAEQSKL